MIEMDIPPDVIVDALLEAGSGRNVCILDSCGVGKPGANLLIAGIDPVSTEVFSFASADDSLAALNKKLNKSGLAAIFTISYDLGLKLLNVTPGYEDPDEDHEPDIFIALFDAVIIHDHDTGRTVIEGSETGTARLSALLKNAVGKAITPLSEKLTAISNFGKSEYISAVEQIQEFIRRGDTYQTNLTQQFRVAINDKIRSGDVYSRLRLSHPAPYSAYIDRGSSVVVSASPEQFLRIDNIGGKRRITASPIKGTMPRGPNEREDAANREALAHSEKDRAENIMIVDLMRNDLGRICEFGSIEAVDVCRIEEHPTLFHMVSTVTGILRDDAGYPDVLQAVFPCGSITGAPKVSTMRLIESLETKRRGISMGAVGCNIPQGSFGNYSSFEMNVAIRTITFGNDEAVFNVGGGIVIDSIPENEFAESMLKAKALLAALNADPLE